MVDTDSYVASQYNKLFFFLEYLQDPYTKLFWISLCIIYFPGAMLLDIFTLEGFNFHVDDFIYAIISSVFWVTGYYLTIHFYELAKWTDFAKFKKDKAQKLTRIIVVAQIIGASTYLCIIYSSYMYDLDKYLKNPIAHHQTSINNNLYGSSFSLGLFFGTIHFLWGLVMLLVTLQIFITVIYIIYREYNGDQENVLYSSMKIKVWNTALIPLLVSIIWVTLLTSPYSALDAIEPMLYLRYYLLILGVGILIFIAWILIYRSADDSLTKALLSSLENEEKQTSILLSFFEFEMQREHFSKNGNRIIFVGVGGIFALVLYYVSDYEDKSKQFLTNPIVIVIAVIIPILILIFDYLFNKHEEQTFSVWMSVINNTKNGNSKEEKIDGGLLKFTLSQIYILLLINKHAINERKELNPYYPKDDNSMNNIIRQLIEKNLLFETPDVNDGRRRILHMSSLGFKTVNYFSKYFSRFVR